MTPPTRLDLSTPANVYPSRPKQEWAQQLRQKLLENLELLIVFAAVGVCVQAVGALDDILNSSEFGLLTRDVLAIEPAINMGDEGSAVRSLSSDVAHLDALIARGV